MNRITAQNGVNALGWAAAAGLVLFVLAPSRPASFPHDYYQWWVAGQAAKTMAVTDIYNRGEINKIAVEFVNRAPTLTSDGSWCAHASKMKCLDLTGTPFFTAVTAAVSSGDFDTDYDRYMAAAALVFGAGFLYFAAALGVSGLVTFLVLAAITLYGWPYSMSFHIATVSAMHAGGLMLTLALLRVRRPYISALVSFLLGCLAVFKPTLLYAPCLMIVGMVVERRWRDASLASSGAALAAAAGVAFPAWYLGPVCTWTNWATQVPASLLQGWWLTGGFPGKLVGARSMAVFRLFALALLGAATLFFWLTRRIIVREKCGWVRDAAAATSGALVYLLSAPIVHGHYFMQATPAVVMAFQPGRKRWPRWALASLGLFLMDSHPLFKRWSLTRWPNHSLITFAGVWIFFVIVIWEFFDRRLSERT